MDPINFIKGYGKVQDLELQHQSPNPNTNTQKKPLVTVISILAILFLSLTFGAMFGVLVHMAASDPPNLPSSSSSNLAEHDTDSVIKAICSVTRYPDSCFSSITITSSCSSPQKFTDPKAIFKLSLQVAITKLSNFKNTMIGDLQMSISAAMTDQETCFDGLEETGSTTLDEVKTKMKKSQEYTSNGER